MQFEENVLYYLEEIQAPSGYKIEAGHEKFYFALGTYGKSIKDLKAAVAKAVKAAKITVDDVHFANTKCNCKYREMRLRMEQSESRKYG